MLHRDPAGRLHCEDGPAIMYPDGWGVWAWHGIRVTQEIIEDPKALNVKRITDESNAERRRTYMEIYGQGRYMAEAGGELLDEVHEPLFPGLTGAKLWRLPHEPEDLVCVECRNSTPEPDGSFRVYSLWVPPTVKTAHEALAWTFGFGQAEDYFPLVET